MDPVQLEQIILNLAVNARDAMPSGGVFTVTAKRVRLETIDSAFLGQAKPGDLVMIEVSDSGQGMPPEVAARVFEPFFTTKELGRGTGLGLSTVYGGVSQAGGSICVKSAVGRGTTFEVLLPMSEGTAEPVASQAMSEAPANQAATVLVAEDDEGVRAFVEEVLRKSGCLVLGVADGVEGKAVVDEYAHQIDLLVTDVVMPNSNGIELAKHFLQARPGSRLMFVTGFSSDPTIEEQAAAMGAQVLLKPFTVDQLLGSVRRALE
jgi:CheY-like chemotaxis protein